MPDAQPKTAPVTHAYLMMLAERLGAEMAELRVAEVDQDASRERIGDLDSKVDRARDKLHAALTRYHEQTIERVEARLAAEDSAA